MGKKATKKPTSIGEQDLPEEGAVYAFKLKDGRYGACRVLRKLPIAKTELSECTNGKDEGWCVRVAVTPWVGKGRPKLAEPQLTEILNLTHHSWTGWKEVYLITVPPGRAFEYVGNLPPSDKDRRQKDRALSPDEWPKNVWAEQVLMQWQWDHADRQQLLAGERQQQARTEEREDRAEARRIAKLSKLSLADFRRSRFLPRWSKLASKAAVAETRQSIQDAIDRMITLGRKPQRKALLAEVKRLIRDWNKLQQKHDGFMTTTERDDLCVHLADLFVVAGLAKDDPIVFFERWEDL
jgi:hypothetical protein